MATNNSINLKNTGIAGYNGAGTFNASPVTAHNVLVGGGTSDTIANVPPSATVGFVLTSNGTGSDPSFQSVSPGANVDFTGDTGTPFSTSAVTIFTDNASIASGSSVYFDATTPNMQLFLTDQNSNVLMGNAAGNATVSGGAGGTQNVGIGQSCLSNLNNGNSNTAVGAVSGNALVGGAGNTLIGNSAGQSYNGSESYNIIVGVNAGSNGESNALRIGGGTGSGAFQQNLAFISGITGTTPVDANSPQVVLCDNTDNVTVVSDPTAGFVLTSNSPDAPTFQAVPVSKIPFTNSGSPVSASPNNGYFITASTTVTLPSGATQGDVIIVSCLTTSIATITANTGQTIRLNSSVSASAGTAVNASLGASVTLVFKQNTAQWCATSIVGTWTVT